MDRQAVISAVQVILQDVCQVKGIHEINYSPHPYTTSPEHIAFASDNYLGMLGEEALIAADAKGIKCGVTGCQVSYKEHTNDIVLILSLKKDLVKDEVQPMFTEVAGILEENNIDGFAFVETEGGFRFIEAQ